MIEQAKKRTYQSKTKTGKEDPKNNLDTFKELGANGKGSNSEPNINSFKTIDKLEQKEPELTELFNLYFVNIAPNLKEPIIPPDLETLRTFVTHPRFQQIPSLIFHLLMKLLYGIFDKLTCKLINWIRQYRPKHS